MNVSRGFCLMAKEKEKPPATVRGDRRLSATANDTAFGFDPSDFISLATSQVGSFTIEGKQIGI